MGLSIPSPKSGGILISYKCPVECKHCYVSSCPKSNSRMSIEDARANLILFKGAGIPEEEVHITGGEPFLDFNYLLRVLETAKEAGYSGIGYTETNAFWATNEKICEDRIKQITERGVKKLCISADIFHQEYIPIDRVKRLISITEKLLGPNSVILRWPSGLEEKKHLGEMSPEEFREYYLREKEFRVRMVGRGFKTLAEYLPKVPLSSIGDSPCLSKMVSKGHYHIDPHNNFFVGIGCVVLEKVDHKKSLLDIISGITNYSNPIFTWLATEGPARSFLSFAKEQGFVNAQEYVDKCHLCFDIRRWLLKNGKSSFEVGPSEAFTQ